MPRTWPWQRQSKEAPAEAGASPGAAPQRTADQAAVVHAVPEPAAAPATSATQTSSGTPSREAPSAEDLSAAAELRRGLEANAARSGAMLMLGARGGVDRTTVVLRDALDTSERLQGNSLAEQVMRSSAPPMDAPDANFASSLSSLISFSDPSAIIEGKQMESPFGKRGAPAAATPTGTPPPAAATPDLATLMSHLEPFKPRGETGATPATGRSAASSSDAGRPRAPLRRFSESVSHESPTAPPAPTPFVARSVPANTELPAIPAAAPIQTGSGTTGTAPDASPNVDTRPANAAAPVQRRADTTSPTTAAGREPLDASPNPAGPVTPTESFRGRPAGDLALQPGASPRQSPATAPTAALPDMPLASPPPGEPQTATSAPDTSASAGLPSGNTEALAAPATSESPVVARAVDTVPPPPAAATPFPSQPAEQSASPVAAASPDATTDMPLAHGSSSPEAAAASTDMPFAPRSSAPEAAPPATGQTPPGTVVSRTAAPESTAPAAPSLRAAQTDSPGVPTGTSIPQLPTPLGVASEAVDGTPPHATAGPGMPPAPEMPFAQRSAAPDGEAPAVPQTPRANLASRTTAPDSTAPAAPSPRAAQADSPGVPSGTSIPQLPTPLDVASEAVEGTPPRATTGPGMPPAPEIPLAQRSAAPETPAQASAAAVAGRTAPPESTPSPSERETPGPVDNDRPAAVTPESGAPSDAGSDMPLVQRSVAAAGPADPSTVPGSLAKPPASLNTSGAAAQAPSTNVPSRSAAAETASPPVTEGGVQSPTTVTPDSGASAGPSPALPLAQRSTAPERGTEQPEQAPGARTVSRSVAPAAAPPPNPPETQMPAASGAPAQPAGPSYEAPAADIALRSPGARAETPSSAYEPLDLEYTSANEHSPPAGDSTAPLPPSVPGTSPGGETAKTPASGAQAAAGVVQRAAQDTDDSAGMTTTTRPSSEATTQPSPEDAVAPSSQSVPALEFEARPSPADGTTEDRPGSVPPAPAPGTGQPATAQRRVEPSGDATSPGAYAPVPLEFGAPPAPTALRPSPAPPASGEPIGTIGGSTAQAPALPGLAPTPVQRAAAPSTLVPASGGQRPPASGPVAEHPALSPSDGPNATYPSIPLDLSTPAANAPGISRSVDEEGGSPSAAAPDEATAPGEGTTTGSLAIAPIARVADVPPATPPSLDYAQPATAPGTGAASVAPTPASGTESAASAPPSRPPVTRPLVYRSVDATAASAPGGQQAALPPRGSSEVGPPTGPGRSTASAAAPIDAGRTVARRVDGQPSAEPAHFTDAFGPLSPLAAANSLPFAEAVPQGATGGAGPSTFSSPGASFVNRRFDGAVTGALTGADRSVEPLPLVPPLFPAAAAAMQTSSESMPLVSPPRSESNLPVQRTLPSSASAPVEMPLAAPATVLASRTSDDDFAQRLPGGGETYGQVSRAVTVDELQTSPTPADAAGPMSNDQVDALTDRVWERIRRKLRIERERSKGIV